MKKIFNFTIEENKLDELKEKAKNKDMSIAGYIKSKIFKDDDEGEFKDGRRRTKE